MEQKPTHYDGSVLFDFALYNETNNEAQRITDEARLNISGNPYYVDVNL